MCAKENLLLALLLFHSTIASFNSTQAEEAQAPGNEAAAESPMQTMHNQQAASAAAAVNGENTATTMSPIKKDSPPDYLKFCFHIDVPQICRDWHTNETNQTNGNGSANKNDPNSCQCRAHATAASSWYCCNITAMSQISTCSNTSSWNNLHINNATISALDLSNPIFQTLHSLAITNGNITELKGSFSRVSSIKCLNISSNNISNISQRALKSAPHLKFLDISSNNLTQIPTLNQNQNITVSTGGNKYLLCADLAKTYIKDSIKFLQPETSYCLMNFTHNWFSSADYVSIKELELAARYQADCPVIYGYGNCTCQPAQMVITDGEKPKMFGSVDCSNLGLIELPPKLPENTFSLNISNNNITSIGNHFHANPTYGNIVQLDANNNQISSMNELEGTKFMDQFNRLYLRNNALSKLPIYLLTNALANSGLGRKIELAGNKLQCDCNSAKVLKYWLLERKGDIPDYGDILCRNMPQRVVELQEIKVCQSPHDWTDYIYYVIATEVILLLALITKVSYDYWVFKTAGYLPWPASKMPKLPCDWLCE